MAIESLPLLPRHKIFAGYKDLRLIYSGTKHVVYHANSIQEGKPVALKMLLNERPSSIESLQLKHERQLLATHNIQGMVKAVDVEDDGGNFAIAMEFAGTTTLADLIAKGPMPFGDFLLIAVDGGLKANVLGWQP